MIGGDMTGAIDSNEDRNYTHNSEEVMRGQQQLYSWEWYQSITAMQKLTQQPTLCSHALLGEIGWGLFLSWYNKHYDKNGNVSSMNSTNIDADNNDCPEEVWYQFVRIILWGGVVLLLLMRDNWVQSQINYINYILQWFLPLPPILFLHHSTILNFCFVMEVNTLQYLGNESFVKVQRTPVTTKYFLHVFNLVSVCHLEPCRQLFDTNCLYPECNCGTLSSNSTRFCSRL